MSIPSPTTFPVKPCLQACTNKEGRKTKQQPAVRLTQKYLPTFTDTNIDVTHMAPDSPQKSVRSNIVNVKCTPAKHVE